MFEHDRSAFAEAQPIGFAPLAVEAPARLDLFPPDGLTPADNARWDELGRDPASPSIFAQPWFTRAGLVHCAAGRRVRIAVVRDTAGDWLGVLPIVSRLRYGKAPFPHWSAFAHPNQFRGTPLVRRGHALRFWQTLLAGLDGRGFGRLALQLNSLPLGDDVTLALLRCCEDANRTCKIDRQYARAVLLPDQPEDPETLKGSRRRRIASLERKAERELGPLEWRVSAGAGAIEPALARFLELERAGWKGEAGSAMASVSGTSAFFAAVAGAAAAAGRIEITELLARGRLLAASVHFTGTHEGFGYKMAYDEALGAYGPGLLLLHRLTAHFRATAMRRIDSCCAPGQEPIGSLWPERMNLIDCGVALGPGLLRRGIGVLGLAEALYHGVPQAA
jgi:CelD/BcsL family acetyltransferase involved in cellulose biosynthesis